MTKQARRFAIGGDNDFPGDHVTSYMCKYAEEIFEAKRITSDSDWLKTNREPDQRFEYYKRGNGNIKWVTPTKNNIYLLMVDNESFTQEQIDKYQLYCRAFFMGVKDVLILKPGDQIPGQNNRRIPEDFLSLITSRKSGWDDTTQYKTCGKGGFLTVMPSYRP